MEGFREQNKFMVYLAHFSGLYMKSLETLTSRKWIIYFFTVYTKIGLVVMPIYILSSMKFIIFDEGSFTLKLAVFRRHIAFWTSLFKTVFFYRRRKEIEELIDLWDSYFKEDLYSERRAEKLRENQRRNILFGSSAWLLNLIGGLVYTVPAFFSKTKKLNHPSGIPYREQSPDYELMAVLDFFRVLMACVSTAGLDCILTIFLSHVVVQVNHLKDSLTDMIDDISLDGEGRVVYATPRHRQNSVGEEENFVGERRENVNVDNGLLKTIENPSEYLERIAEFERKMRIWILHHQQLIRFFQKVERIFTPVMSVELVYVIFYTCFTAFHLVRVKFGIDVFVAPFVASGNLVSLIIICYMGVQAEVGCVNLFEGGFGRSWFLYPKKIKSSFSFIILRGRKPLILRGISLFRINLSTFFQVMKVTYQLFAFLLQVSSE